MDACVSGPAKGSFLVRNRGVLFVLVGACGMRLTVERTSRWN